MPDRMRISPGETLEVLERTPAVLVLEAAYAPGGSAPPSHYHPDQDEHFEVLQGALRVEIAGVERDLRAGETLEIPRRTPHRMWNPNAEPARSRWETRPAGRTEEWFAALAALQGTDRVDSRGRPKLLAFAALADEYRDTFRLAARPDKAVRVVVRALAGVARASGRAPQQPQRDVGALSGPAAGIAFASGLAAGIAVADAPYPRPGAKPAAIRRYFGASARAARISVAGQLVSAAALARFGASVATLARTAEPSRPRLSTAARGAGALAAGSLAASALSSLALTLGPRRPNTAIVALHRRVFVLGGPVHTAAFGALVGCLSLAGRRGGALPRGLTTAGLASATAGVLSPLALLVDPAVWLIPAARVSGLVICGAAGARMSRYAAQTSPR
jgi:hypothetical protein